MFFVLLSPPTFPLVFFSFPDPPNCTWCGAVFTTLGDFLDAPPFRVSFFFVTKTRGVYFLPGIGNGLLDLLSFCLPATDVLRPYSRFAKAVRGVVFFLILRELERLPATVILVWLDLPVVLTCVASLVSLFSPIGDTAILKMCVFLLYFICYPYFFGSGFSIFIVAFSPQERFIHAFFCFFFFPSLSETSLLHTQLFTLGFERRDGGIGYVPLFFPLSLFGFTTPGGEVFRPPSLTLVHRFHFQLFFFTPFDRGNSGTMPIFTPIEHPVRQLLGPVEIQNLSCPFGSLDIGLLIPHYIG